MRRESDKREKKVRWRPRREGDTATETDESGDKSRAFLGFFRVRAIMRV